MASVVYSSDIEDMRGAIGERVYSRARSGATVRGRVTPSNPRTVSQSQARLNFGRAAAAYKNLLPAQAALWRAYAQTLTVQNRKTGQPYTPSGNTVFAGLAAKFLQINPTGTIPVTPPASGFAGDAVTLTAAGATGHVTFTANAPNSAGVKTELLLQHLPSANRMPGEGAYRSEQFVAFAGTGLTSNVNVSPGWYAPAYKFVNTATGQESPLVPLPAVLVG